MRRECRDDTLVEAVKSDYTKANIDGPTRALLDWAVKLTRTPGAMKRSDLESLRSHGFSDSAIQDAAQIVAWFNYINRIADGLGVDLEPEMQPPSA